MVLKRDFAIDPVHAVRGVPSQIAARIRSLGKALDKHLIDTTRDLYLALHQQLPKPEVELLPDLAYGPDPRHLLDVHLPRKGFSRPAATVIYFHGGGFVGGEKNLAGRHIHGNIADYFAQHDCIGINATYRVAPAATWPAGAQDVGAALAWAREHVAEHGGDPERIFLMGQSAGATHVATYAFRKDMHPPGGPGLAGVILMSGPYVLQAGKVSPNAIAYFGDDASRYAERQVLGNIDCADFPVYVGVSEFDPPQFEGSALELMAALFRHTGKAPRFKQYLGHNHVSPAFSFGTDDPTVAPDVLDFVCGVRA